VLVLKTHVGIVPVQVLGPVCPAPLVFVPFDDASEPEPLVDLAAGLELPDPLGDGSDVGCGDGDADGVGVGSGDALGLGVGEGDGDGDAVGDGVELDV
jgi:hypothetical protein